MLLECYKDGVVVETIQLSASKRLYTVGRQQGVSDIVLSHASISREQATLTVSASGTVVVTDLGSAQGTHISGKRIPPKKPHTLPPGRSLVFGKSTRVYKLQEGAGGFMTEVEAAPAPKPQRAYNEPLATALLSVLRRGALDDGRRLRPDGFTPLKPLLKSSALTSFKCNEAQAHKLVGDTDDLGLFELRTEADALLIRAAGGHEASAGRLDLSLRLRACAGDEELPPHAEMVHGAQFRDWNAIRSAGLGGASVGGGAVVRFWTRPPVKGEKMFGAAPHVLVHVRAGALTADGMELFVEEEEEEGEGVQAGQGGAEAEADAPRRRTIVCAGDPAEGGVVGVWHFEKVLNARDGSELMGADEIAPLREAHSKELARQQQAEQARLDARLQKEEAKQRKAAETQRAEESARAGQAQPRYNPYLAHLDEEAGSKRKRNGDEDEEEEEDEDY